MLSAERRARRSHADGSRVAIPALLRKKGVHYKLKERWIIEDKLAEAKSWKQFRSVVAFSTVARTHNRLSGRTQHHYKKQLPFVVAAFQNTKKKT